MTSLDAYLSSEIYLIVDLDGRPVIAFKSNKDAIKFVRKIFTDSNDPSDRIKKIKLQ